MLKKLYGGDIMPDIIHFGCGTDFRTGELNIDSHIDPYNLETLKTGPDCTWVMEGWWDGPQQLPKSHFSLIRAIMVMEHIHPTDVPNQLYCFANALAFHGLLQIVVPNFAHLAKVLIELNQEDRDWTLEDWFHFHEITNEFMFPNKAGEQGHQSIWLHRNAEFWLNCEGFRMESFTQKGMCVEIMAMFVGGDHVKCIA